MSAREIPGVYLTSPPVPPQTFELALVLGGTVSAGAYTAGVVDFLIEALDCFSRAKALLRAPQHDVVLKVITGTSGGAVNAAITARALAFDFPHVTHANSPGTGMTGNPFYDVWVNILQLDGFLDPSDTRALFSAQPIAQGADYILNFHPSPVPSGRFYVGEPLRLIITFTNLRGIPYRIEFGQQFVEIFINHADYARFGVVYPWQGAPDPWPDEQILDFLGARLRQATNWKVLSEFACTSAAFPFGFPPVALACPAKNYQYRYVVVPSDSGGQPSVLALEPEWPLLGANEQTIPEYLHFPAVDGGATDNEPIALAHNTLAGLLGRDPRDKNLANRALLLIDPFAGETRLGPELPPGLTGLIGPFLQTFLQQTRYDSADLLLAADPNVFSRFMISPIRAGKIGGAALASSGLGAFLGFASADFRRFDYFLGRQNCQAYLRNQFTLGEANPLFKNWTPAERDRFRTSDGELPIIPLVGDAAVDEVLDPWPKGKLDPERYRSAIERRYKALLESEAGGGFFSSILAWMGAKATEREVADWVIGAIQQALVAADLA
ncbi:MAG: patatin-like phospholipase family protein [Acidobacteriia bacterium]|nr:hypothetical protein [Methyloceanibacter sp.]MCL6493031.1 patatin-like phospholipase family protein [Terriglobia bacterium]